MTQYSEVHKNQDAFQYTNYMNYLMEFFFMPIKAKTDMKFVKKTKC